VVVAAEPPPDPARSESRSATSGGFDDLDLAWLRAKPGAKWQRYGPGPLAAWLADMDFPTPPPVAAALHRLIDAGDLGYPDWPDGTPLRSLFARRMGERFGWTAPSEHVRETCDVLQGVQMALLLATPPGSLIALHTPSYPPFLETSVDMGRPILPIPAAHVGGRWSFDHDRLATDLAAAGGRCRTLLLCNPHNPTGHVFTRDELADLAALAEEHDLLIISDEIHADLVYAPHRHVPVASLGPSVADRTVTLTSATKAFNLAGVRCALAHLGPGPLRAAWDHQPRRLHGVVSVLGAEATRAAWEDGDRWLEAALAHLDRNRHLLGRLLASHLPAVGYTPPDATYLAWLDLRGAGLAAPGPDRVVLAPGPDFGPGGEGFARLNFATSAAVLEAIVGQLAAAPAAG
jgi:cystathionine beta-lyase